ncbi:MAG TPA: nuclear transport factor 2 family protein [Longimicrobiaceae bacterium]|nr:nuclear transport factor 2 family protein [Longimicrobiaceae bacterium]
MQEQQRRSQLKAIAEAYFDGLSRRDVSAVPWDDGVVLYAPLGPGGLAEPLRGRETVVQWFSGLYPVLGEARVIDHYYNQDLTAIATRADVQITDPPCTLRVVDRFTVNSEGRITEQENHYDPRPALGGG